MGLWHGSTLGDFGSILTRPVNLKKPIILTLAVAFGLSTLPSGK
jgi:hypothetical protein